MGQFHKIHVTLEEHTGEGFDNEAMRTLAQDIVDFADERAAALGLSIDTPVSLYYRSEYGDTENDADIDRLLAVFYGVRK